MESPNGARRRAAVVVMDINSGGSGSGSAIGSSPSLFNGNNNNGMNNSIGNNSDIVSPFTPSSPKGFRGFSTLSVPTAVTSSSSSLSSSSVIAVARVPRPETLEEVAALVASQDQEIRLLRQQVSALTEFVEAQSVRVRRFGWRLGAYMVGRLHSEGQVCHSGNVTGLVTSNDGRTAVSSSLDTTMIFWSLETGAPIARVSGHDGGVGCLAQSRDGSFLCSGGADQTLRVWDRKTGAAIAVIDVPALVYSACFSVTANAHEDRVLLFAGLGNGQIHVYSLDCAVLDVQSSAAGVLGPAIGGRAPEEPYTLLRTLTGHHATVSCLACDDSERFLFSGSRDASIRRWDLESYETTHMSGGHKGGVSAIRVRGDTVFFCSVDALVKRVSARDLSEIKPFFKHSGVVCDIDVDAAGSLLAASGADGIVKIFSVTPCAAECIRTFTEAEDVLRAPTKARQRNSTQGNASGQAPPVLVVRLCQEMILTAAGRTILVRQLNTL